MQSPHRSYATQATLAGMSNQGDNEATLSALSTADLGYAGTLGSQAYLASTDSRGRLIQVDPRQDAQIRTQNSQRHAQLQASGNETVSKWNNYNTFDDGSEGQGNLFDGQSHRYQPTAGPVRGAGRGRTLGPRPQPVNRTATPYTPRSTPATFDGLRGPVPTGPSGRYGRGYTSPSHRGRGGRGYTPPGRGSTPTGPLRHGPAPVGLRQRADSPSRYGTIRDFGGRRERQPTPSRHGGVARQPPARSTPQLTLSRASDIDHSRDSSKNQDATRLQVPPRVSRAGNVVANKDSGKNQDAARLQVPPRVSRADNPSGNPLIAQWQLQTACKTQPAHPTRPARTTQPVRPSQPVRPTQSARPVQPRSELEMSQDKVDILWAAAYRADCDFLETSMVSQETDGPAIARAKILTIYSALTSEGASKIVSNMGPQWECIHDHARWCFVMRAFRIAFNGGYEQTGKLAEMTANFTEFGKLWQDARDAINEANVITKAVHLIPASKQKWKDMDKLDVLEEAMKRTEEAANAAAVEERDAAADAAAVAAAEMDVDTSIEQTVEYRHHDSADAQGYGTTTTISGPGVQPASGPVQTHPGAHLHITQGGTVPTHPRARLHITQGSINLVDVSVFELPAGTEATLAVELEGDSPPLTRNLVESYLEALRQVTENLRRGRYQQAYYESDSSDTT